MSAATAAASPPALTPARRRMVSGTLILASVLQTLDSTIANVALPRMQGTLSASQDQITWVLTSYIVATAIMTPLSGWLADHFGRKRVILASIIGFTVTSALCGMADSIAQIVLFRMLQGLCGAALIPISQAILFDIYPTHQHARAMSMWSVGVILGPMLGPILGGYLTDHYSWRWVFFINVPLGLLAALGVMTFFRRPHVRQSRRFDFFGFATLSIAVGALQLLLDRGSLKDWFGSTEIRLETVAAVFAFYLFVVHSLTTPNPFIRISLFKDRNFVIGNVFIFVIGVFLFATMSLLPTMLQSLMGYSVLDAGLLISPRSVGSLVAMAIVAPMMRHVDSRLIIAGGFLLAAESLWAMSHFALAMDRGPFVWTSLTQGLGAAICYVPVIALSFATIPGLWRNEATAMFNLVRNLGSSVGISMVQALLVRNVQVQHAVLSAQLTPARIETLHHSLSFMPYRHAGLAALNAEVTAQASIVAYIDDFHLMFVLVLLVLPMLLLVRKAKPPTPEEQHAALD